MGQVVMVDARRRRGRGRVFVAIIVNGLITNTTITPAVNARR